MRKLAFFALAIVAVGCSQAPEDAPAGGGAAAVTAQPGVTSSQLRAFEQMQRETNRTWTWLQHETRLTPMHLSAPRTGPALLTAGDSPSRVTLAFLRQYRDLFKIHDAEAELRLARSEVDALSMTHVRFQQVTHGVPVAGAELSAHYDAAGRLTSIDANVVAGAHDLDVQPTLRVEDGLRAALADIVATTRSVDPARLSSSEGKLVVYAPDGGPPALAYQYRVRAVYGSAPAIWVSTVDARTGQVLHRYDDLQTIDATGTGVLGDTKKFQVTPGTGAAYTMTDTSRGVSIQTFTANGAQDGPGQGASAVTSPTLTSWDTDSSGAGAAVDAHFNAGVVFDYYKKVHGRNAIDGAGGTMYSTAHFGQAFDNAFWDGTGMSYGDGGDLFKPLSAGLDVCGHEFTHGVTAATSNLDYEAQSGALNESVSDIFGVFIEHSLTPDDTNNWLMGEKIVKQSGLMRDFKNPANGQQPANMSVYVNTQQDNGGVHINSGIPNNAAYLMTMGGTNPVSNVVVAFGLGWEKAQKLWYQSNTKYFVATTSFAQAAQGTMSAGKDIGLTDNELNIVDCAWKAVGVVQGTCSPITRPDAVGTPPVTPAGTAQPPATSTGATPGGGDSSASAPDEGAPGDGTTTKPKSTHTSLAQSSGGCSVGALAIAPSGDLGTFALGLASVLGLVMARRKRDR